MALVGTSGEGKTTLLRLILGLIEPDTGKAILKAQDKTEQKLNADTRVCFSYVPQGNTLLAGSIAENLSIAKEGASREEMKTALEMACAWEFVKNCRKDWRQNWVNAEKGFPKDSRSGLPSHGHCFAMHR